MWLWPEGQKMLACPLQCCCTQMGPMNGPEVRRLLSGGCPPLPCERDCPVDAWKCLLSFICLCYNFVNRYFGSNLGGRRCTQCYSRVNLYSLVWHPTPVLLPGNSHGQRSLVGFGP